MSQTTSRARPTAFLDRDGVLNVCSVDDKGIPHPPHSVEALSVLPGVIDACKALKDAGYLLICITNQPDVARGTQTKDRIEAINERLKRELGLDAVYACYHDNADNCDCRKPKPGMIRQAVREHPIDLSRSFLVGDRSGDILAGEAVGIETFLIDMPYSKRDRCTPRHCVRSLLEAVDIVLSRADPAR